MKLKKELSILLATVLLLTCIPLGAVGVSAETSDDYTYTVSDGEATITGYTGSGGTITIPSTLGGYPVTTIGEWAFGGWAFLTSVTIPDSVTTIGWGAFSGCTNLTSVTIPNSVTTIGEYAFGWCEFLTSVTIPDSVTTIGGEAFYNCTSLTSVTIPDSVTTIGGEAFYYCTSLTSVIIPDSVTTIGTFAFSGCTSLTSVTIGDSVTTIGREVFAYCSKLTSVTIGDSVTTIRYGAFLGCTSLTSVTIPDSVTSIGDYVFYKCTSLTAIAVDENNVNYCSVDGVLFNKDKTKLVQYPAGKPSTSYTIPDSVTTIGGYAFWDCTSLTSVTILDSVTTIGKWAFCYCTSLTAIEVDEDNVNYCSADGVLFNKDKTTLVQYPAGKPSTSYTIPDSVTTIGGWAFNCCISLTSVTIPNSITAISDYAFEECYNLNTVTIPDSVTTIGDGAFYGCTNLTDVYYTGAEADKAAISIGSDNTHLINATWHYPSDPFSADVQHSVMDTENGNGLAFRFQLEAEGVTTAKGNVADLTNATVNYLGQTCKLVGMGAVVTNNAAVGTTDFTQDAVNGVTVMDVPVVYLCDYDTDYTAFSIRIINIPDSALERTIYARPYYIVEVEGEQITVYGDTDATSCQVVLDSNA